MPWLISAALSRRLPGGGEAVSLRGEWSEVPNLNEEPPLAVDPNGQPGAAAPRRAPGRGAFGSEGGTLAGADEGTIRRDDQIAPAVGADTGVGEPLSAPADREEPPGTEGVVDPFRPESLGRPGVDGSCNGGGTRSLAAAGQHTGGQEHELPAVQDHRQYPGEEMGSGRRHFNTRKRGWRRDPT
jgi:hypothetical protein